MTEIKKKYVSATLRENEQWQTIDVSLCLDDFWQLTKELKEGKSPAIKESKNGKKYLSLRIKKRMEVGQYGDTHLIEVNEYVKGAATAEQKQQDDDDAPF